MLAHRSATHGGQGVGWHCLKVEAEAKVNAGMPAESADSCGAKFVWRTRFQVSGATSH